MTTGLTKPIWTVLGVILAVLAARPSARGGCVHPTGVPRLGEAHLEMLAEVEEPWPSPPTPVSPCRGLRCSGIPASTPAIPRIEAEDLERWVCLDGLATPPDPSPSHLLHLPCPLGPSHGGPTPFHPPR